jgi:hypothetical protein
MKKIVASVGLVAVGVTGLQAASDVGPSGDGQKPWSVGVTLRGFYDDNVNALPKDAAGPKDSFGFEVSPTLSLGLSMDQTTIGFNYLFSMKWYDRKPLGNTDHEDFTHTFNLDFSHAFTERLRLDVKDSFVIGQEPDTLRAGNAYDTFQRISGDNIRNFGSIDLNWQATRELGFDLGYQNTYVDYADSGFAVSTESFNPFTGNYVGSILPSHSGTLDRIENSPHLDAKITLQPQTIGVVGYSYRQVDYTGDEVVGGTYVGPTPDHPSANDVVDPLKSDVRNSQSHYGYAGVDHTFRPDLSGSLRAGARYTEYPNDPANTTDVAPYAMLTMHYVYAPESYVEVGGSYDMNSTDLFSYDPTKKVPLTLNAQSATGWLSLTHRITPKLFGSLMGQIQSSTYYGGAYDNETDMFYLVGVNLEYRFNQHFSTHVGYNYDRLDSDVPGRTFDRNRVYLGVTATY